MECLGSSVEFAIFLIFSEPRNADKYDAQSCYIHGRTRVENVHRVHVYAVAVRFVLQEAMLQEAMMSEMVCFHSFLIVVFLFVSHTHIHTHIHMFMSFILYMSVHDLYV